MKFIRLLEFCSSFSSSREDIQNRLPKALKQNPQVFEPYEKALQKLDAENWELIKQKLKKRLIKHSLRGWSQFFETLSEVKGFSYLIDEKCSSIKFILESSISTPDMKGKQSNGNGVLLESKVIGFSNDERKYILENSERLSSGQELVIRKVEEGLSNGLGNKIRKTIESAKVQLFSYKPSDATIRRIIYLTVQLDIPYMLDPRKYAEVVNFFKRLIKNETDVEIIVDREISTI